MKGSRGLWLIVPWALFGLIALGWVGYWNFVASTAENRINSWVAAQNNAGAQASYLRIVRHGFPVLLRLEIQSISYGPARGGWRATTPRADVNIEMLQPEHIIFQAAAPIAVTRSDGAVTNVVADRMIASLRTQNGQLAVAGVEADNLTLDDPAQQGVLSVQKFVANARPDPRAAGQYQLAMQADQLTLPRPVRSFEAFGVDVQHLQAAIVIEHGAALLRTDPNDPLGPWREADGKLRFEGLALRWGPLETTGSGEGTLDAQRRLQGRLVIPVQHPAPVLTAISNGDNVNHSAQQALRLLAASYVVSGNQITLDVNADNGVLRVEGLSVRTLPPVY